MGEMAGTNREQVDRRIDAQLDESIELLKRLCRQPSVAAQNLGMRECADLVAGALAELGIRAQIMETAGGRGAPVVYGEGEGRRNDRTLIFYNHYDVQPA